MLTMLMFYVLLYINVYLHVNKYCIYFNICMCTCFCWKNTRLYYLHCRNDITVNINDSSMVFECCNIL